MKQDIDYILYDSQDGWRMRLAGTWEYKLYFDDPYSVEFNGTKMPTAIDLLTEVIKYEGHVLQAELKENKVFSISVKYT